MNNEMLTVMFRPKSLVIISMADGTRLQGTIEAFVPDGISIRSAEGAPQFIGTQQLQEATYLYIGFPTLQTEEEKPRPVSGNATIVSGNATMVRLRDASGQQRQNLAVYLDPQLRLAASSAPDSLQGRPVLYVLRDEGGMPKLHLIEATTIDQALDHIAAMAAKGHTELAIAFTQLLKDQCPADAERYMQLLAQPEVKKPEGTDFYSPFGETDADTLTPMGRIYEVGERNCFLIDVRSHEKLFFFREQLLGDLEKLSAKQLVGQPVVYTITPSPDKRGYQARTVLRPMTIEDTYLLAEEMHYDYSSKRTLNAYDILRIINAQLEPTGDDDDADHPDEPDTITEALSQWRNNYVRDNIWPVAVPTAYSGPTVSLRKAVDKAETAPGVMLTHDAHTMMVPSGSFVPPEAPIIAFGQLPEHSGNLEVSESSEFSEYSEHPEKSGHTERSEHSEKSEHPENFGNSENAKNSEISKHTESATSSFPVSLEEIDADPDSDKPIKANATISYGFGEGVLTPLAASNNTTYKFTIDDIADDELRKLVLSRSQSTSHVKNRPVVARLNPFGGTATNICDPYTVGEVLRKAWGTYAEALRLHDEAAGSNDDSDDDLAGYRRALGLAETALAAAPANALAIAMKDAIEQTINTDDGNYYKAPSQAVAPSGFVWSVNANGMVSIKDRRFNKNPLLAQTDIVDRNYHTVRRQDQLVYAVYYDNNRNRMARFAMLARTPDELLLQAKDWQDEGQVVKAWGIARLVLDADAANERAQLIVSQCEAATDHEGQPLVSEQLRSEWNLPVRQNKYASAMQAGKMSNREKLDLLLQEIADMEENDPNNLHDIHRNIIVCLKRYHDLFAAAPDDDALRREYSHFGKQYVLGTEGGGYCISMGTPSLTSIENVIQYHSDMGNTNELTEALWQQVRLLSRDKHLAPDEKRGKIAQAYANRSWIYVRNLRDTDAANNVQLALDTDPTNALACVCKAVLCGRNKRSREEKETGVNFSAQHIRSLSQNWLQLMPLSTTAPQDRNLIAERFSLLCAIVDTTDRDVTQRLLARYLLTLSSTESRYRNEMKEAATLPADCWFAYTLYACMTQQKATWSGWMDVRLAAMLSTQAARCLCETMYDLDSTAACNMLIASGIEVRHTDNPRWTYFKSRFEEWRGENYQKLFRDLLNKTDQLNEEMSLTACAEFLRSLRHEQWMQQADGGIIAGLRQQLPAMLVGFATATNSRQLITLSRRIQDETASWLQQIEHRPTVLALTALHRLLGNITATTQQLFDEKSFSMPRPSARLLQASAIGDDDTMVLEVEIVNQEPYAYAMDNCQLSIVNPACELTETEPPVTYDDAGKVYGGEGITFMLKFKLGAALRCQPEAALQLCLTYSVNDGQPLSSQLYVRFGITSSFKSIDDQYATGGLALTDFYGRENDIHRVLSLLVQKKGLPQFLIYGQKRCGKSSILHHIRERVSTTDYLQQEFGYPGKFVCVGIDFLGYIGEITCENDIYYKLWNNIHMELLSCSWDTDNDPQRDPLPESILQEPDAQKVSFDRFINYLVRVNHAFEKTRGWHNYRLLLFIDEFTSVLQWLQKHIIDQSFMQRWKALQTRQLFAAVLIGQDVLDAFVRDFGAANALQGFDGLIHLNYLDTTAGRQLVTIPIIRASGNSEIFLKGAIDRILYYSASSPLYTRWVCAAIIAHMNRNRLSTITVADVEHAIRHRINNNTPSNNEVLFNPLTYPGQDLSETDFKEEQTIAVLDQVAMAEWRDPELGCNKKIFDIKAEDVASILNNLRERMVLDENGNYYKIKVKLYMLWTRKRIYGIA